MNKFGDFEKKGKVWKYWYQNGQISRIENYRFVKDKSPNDLRDGKWMYFNEQGVKYREDTYLNGNLIASDKEIYKDSRLAGSITLKNEITDTTLSEPLSNGNNLIINPDFDYFYYKPEHIIYDGRSKIDEWIPFWVSPGNYTPDYISDLRTIDVLSNYYLFEFPLPEKFTYAGLGLYRENTSYSEYIRGRLTEKLSKGHKYCIKVSIALPSYSGFSVNRLALLLSPYEIMVDENNETSFHPQIIFSTLDVGNKRFVSLCDYFVAEGGEQYITIGRFTSPEKLKIIKRANIPQSQFGIEASAYYLIDNVELHEIREAVECDCKTDLVRDDTIHVVPVAEMEITETDLNNLKPGKTVILRNVNFNFNSYALLPEADSTMRKLLTYMKDNPGVKLMISGHTDDLGGDEYNRQLSVNRAKSVYAWLIGNGIEARRLEFTGFGKSRPLFDDTGEKSRALNRRVEVKIIYPISNALN
jgi:outer membrane protein OmpA-like peptidoglycan-associated protein